VGVRTTAVRTTTTISTTTTTNTTTTTYVYTTINCQFRQQVCDVQCPSSTGIPGTGIEQQVSIQMMMMMMMIEDDDDDDDHDHDHDHDGCSGHWFSNSLTNHLTHSLTCLSLVVSVIGGA